MFRHQGKSRTFSHNLRIATLLSFVAGVVNVTGILEIQVLTTNVTGHFAYFSEQIMEHQYLAAFAFFVFILFFLLGAFTSNFIVELVTKTKPEFSHVIPLSIEIVLLFIIGLFGASADATNLQGKIIAFTLLFAMGLQNALVTRISQSTVRTTHLTGLFTDLGIELSQLFFYTQIEEKKKLKRNIFLRVSIITLFFLGCFVGGLLYQIIALKTLFLGCLFLFIALFYDYFRLKIYYLNRKKNSYLERYEWNKNINEHNS